MSKYRVFSGRYFLSGSSPNAGYSLYFRIQFESGKIRTRKNSVFGLFSRSDIVNLHLVNLHFSFAFFHFFLLYREFTDNVNLIYAEVVSNKAEGPISERVFQKNKARRILRKTNIFLPPDTHRYMCVSRGKNFVFRKIWRALFS